MFDIKKKFIIKIFILILLVFSSIFLSIKILSDFRVKNSLKINLKKTDLVKKNNIENLGFKITTDAEDVFSLTKQNQIFIYTNIRSKKNFKLYGFNENEKLCLETKFDLYLNISLNNIKNSCKDSYLFRAKIEYNDEYIHFFFSTLGRRNEISNSKNLIIIPISYLFLTYNNTKRINQNDLDNSSSIFLTTSKNFPKVINDEMYDFISLIESLTFFQKLKINYSIALDYQIKNINLKSYDNLIFPHHQEYIEKEALIKLDEFLNSNDEKKIFAVGESFKHFYKYDKNSKIFEMKKNNNVSFEKFRFVTDYIDYNLSKRKCKYMNYKIEGIHVDFKNSKPQKLFELIKCNNENYNLISKKNFGKNSFYNFNFENLIQNINKNSQIYNFLFELF